MSHYENNRHRPGNKVAFGFIIILIGLAIFLKQIDMLPYFDLSSTWPIILIIVGVLIGIKNKFRNTAPFILIAVGVFNLIPGFSFKIGANSVDSEELVIPTILILAGIVMIFKPRKKKHWADHQQITIVGDKNMCADVMFGGRKEIITSKEFNGGNITVTFGGCELNLLQADSTDQNIIVDVRIIFGGCEIIVPSHWDIKNEIEPVFGSVEDQRTLRTPDVTENRKTLILRGSCTFGGIEIKSF